MSKTNAMFARQCALVALSVSMFACRTPSAPDGGRYLVTERPMHIEQPGLDHALCIAVDPTDKHGVWWWEPYHSGCSSRSSGPGVFHAEEATLSQPAPGGPIAASFRLSTHSDTQPFITVRLVIEGGTMRPQESHGGVPIERRKDLKVPDIAGRVAG